MSRTAVDERPGPSAGRPARANVLPAALLAASGVVLFGFEQRPAGYAVLTGCLVTAALIDRAMARDLLLIAAGLVVMSVQPVTTDITWSHMLTMGTAMVLAIAIPYLVSRHVYRDHAVRFPIRTGRRWTRFEWGWLAAVVALGYLVLPAYMIPTGVYKNWPAASGASEVGRLFLGTNALGIWDELFFICTCFALLRRHLPEWWANATQAVLFTSFLHELGFTSWGPLLIFPFAMIQGYTFARTRSLSYVVAVHLTFDLILFGVLLHAHQRAWVDVFLV